MNMINTKYPIVMSWLNNKIYYAGKGGITVPDTFLDFVGAMMARGNMFSKRGYIYCIGASMLGGAVAPNTLILDNTSGFLRAGGVNIMTWNPSKVEVWVNFDVTNSVIWNAAVTMQYSKGADVLNTLTTNSIDSVMRQNHYYNINVANTGVHHVTAKYPVMFVAELSKD
jgi:hypothetical protein